MPVILALRKVPWIKSKYPASEFIPEVIWQGFREEFSTCAYKMETVVKLLHLIKVFGSGFWILNRKEMLLYCAVVVPSEF